MKIVIVGAGNAGCLTALSYAHFFRFGGRHHVTGKFIEIELRHDPTILPERVGQATLLGCPRLLGKMLGIDWYDERIRAGAVPKLGILYEGWGKKQQEIFTSVPLNTTAMHISPRAMREMILSSGTFKVVEEAVAEVENIDADYVFDCRGTPENWDDYEELNNPLNAVLLGEKPGRDFQQLWTRTVATPDGWTFVIPLPTSTSYGYLYNSSITSREEATTHFKELFDVEVTRQINFKNYMATSPVKNERIILGGNRLFFLEPLEATAMASYLKWAQLTFDDIVDRDGSPLNAFKWPRLTNKWKQFIHEIENFILWHYQFGSKYETPFWDYAQSLTFKDDRFDQFLRTATQTKWKELTNGPGSKGGYGQWQVWHFKNWLSGVK